MGAAFAATFYFLLALGALSQLGPGHVRVGGLLGGYLGFLGRLALAAGTLAGWLLVALAMAFRRPDSAGRRAPRSLHSLSRVRSSRSSCRRA